MTLLLPAEFLPAHLGSQSELAFSGSSRSVSLSPLCTFRPGHLRFLSSFSDKARFYYRGRDILIWQERDSKGVSDVRWPLGGGSAGCLRRTGCFPPSSLWRRAGLQISRQENQLHLFEGLSLDIHSCLLSISYSIFAYDNTYTHRILFLFTFICIVTIIFSAHSDGLLSLYFISVWIWFTSVCICVHTSMYLRLQTASSHNISLPSDSLSRHV